MPKKALTLSFGKLEFTHRPLTMLAVIKVFDKEALLPDALGAFADFVNLHGLSKDPVSWEDIAAQGSQAEFVQFLKDWQSVGDTGNLAENSKDS